MRKEEKGLILFIVVMILLILLIEIGADKLHQDIYLERYAKVIDSFYRHLKAVDTSAHFRIADSGDFYFLKIIHKRDVKTFKILKNVENPTFILTSSTHAGFLKKLNMLDAVVGVTFNIYFYSDELREKVEVFYGGMPNIELIKELKPTYWIETYPSSYTYLVEDYVQVIPIYEYLEKTPLARAEWIKVFGILTGRYDLAIKVFDSISSRYNLLKIRTIQFKHKPTVIVNIPRGSVWEVPGKYTYMAAFIRDAGGNYLWNDLETDKTVSLNIEEAYQRAVNADILLNPYNATSIDEIIKLDPRLENLKAIKNEQVYNYTKKMKSEYAFAFWEDGVIEPDKILSDLINIFHPENDFADREMHYYERLKRR